jgi:hypothetical protein
MYLHINPQEYAIHGEKFGDDDKITVEVKTRNRLQSFYRKDYRPLFPRDINT